MTSDLHARIDQLPKRTRSTLYYAVGLSTSSAAWLIDAYPSVRTAASLVLLASAFVCLMFVLSRMRSRFYCAVGLAASSTAWLIVTSPRDAAYLVLLAAAVFLLMRFLRELRPDRLAGPPEMRLL